MGEVQGVQGVQGVQDECLERSKKAINTIVLYYLSDHRERYSLYSLLLLPSVACETWLLNGCNQNQFLFVRGLWLKSVICISSFSVVLLSAPFGAHREWDLHGSHKGVTWDLLRPLPSNSCPRILFLMQSYEIWNWRLRLSVNKRAITGHFPEKNLTRRMKRQQVASNWQ